jgi:hypothetical protein
MHCPPQVQTLNDGLRSSDRGKTVTKPRGCSCIMSEVSGRQIYYVDVPEAAARQAMLGAHLP